jgi:hypothetical protein
VPEFAGGEDDSACTMMDSLCLADTTNIDEHTPPPHIIAAQAAAPGGVVVYPPTPGAHRPYYKSPGYLREEAKFSRNRSGDVIYDGNVICRYVSTARGCRQRASCRFLHKALGCVFYKMAHQGCVYANSGDCPFSHESDAVVVAPTLANCKNYSECGHSCMFFGSTCLTCFNRSAGERRGRVRQQQHERRETFEPAGASLASAPTAASFQSFYQPVPTTRSYFEFPVQHIGTPPTEYHAKEILGQTT